MLALRRLWLGLAGLVWLGLAALLSLFAFVAAAVNVGVFMIVGPIAAAAAALGIALVLVPSHGKALGWLSLLLSGAVAILAVLAIDGSSVDFRTMLIWVLASALGAVTCSGIGVMAKE